MWLIVGLGNPGSRYEGTPHNLGFEVVRLLARRHGMTFRPSNRVRAYTADGMISGERCHLLMPTTFMNLSGEAAAPYARYYDIPDENVLTVSDDVNLPWGKLRIRRSGSHGGHNGLRNMILHLGTDKFPRVRIGCAPERPDINMVQYVLTKIWGEGLELAPIMVETAADAVETILAENVTAAMNKYNAFDAAKEE